MIQTSQGLVVLEHYRLTRFLGRGGAGEVWEAIGPAEIPKAVKIAQIGEEADDLAARELDGLRKMRTIKHPFLLHIERFEVVGDSLIVVMELAESSLKDRFGECQKSGEKGIPRNELLKYLKEAAEALDYLRDKFGLQHLDVKPGNLFLSQGHVKVADYGLVHPHSAKAPSSTFALSPNYAPPELFDGDIEPSADQYSLAVTFQELLTGTRPYSGSCVRALLAAHYRSKADLSALTVQDRRIVGQAIDRDPSQRHASCMAFVDQLRKANAFAAVERQPAPTASFNGMKSAERPPSHGSPMTRSAAPTVSVDAALKSEPESSASIIVPPEKRFTSTFLAFVPLQIYAHKLRGFIDELDAEVVECTEERALLRFTKRNWFGKRDVKNAVFMQIDACAHNPGSGYRVIEAIAWSANTEESMERLRTNGALLLSMLRCHLIAADKVNATKAAAKAKAALMA
jgi:serine/threonine protein kinase